MVAIQLQSSFTKIRRNLFRNQTKSPGLAKLRNIAHDAGCVWKFSGAIQCIAMHIREYEATATGAVGHIPKHYVDRAGGQIICDAFPNKDRRLTGIESRLSQHLWHG